METLQARSTFDKVRETLTTAVHFTAFFYTVLVLYLCFSTEFKFFTYHPLLLAFGWMFLMFEAVLTLTSKNTITTTLSYADKVKWHWILQSIALVCVLIGVIVVFVNKNHLNKEHFTTWHGTFGLFAVLSCIPAALHGVATLYNQRIKRYLKPKVTKILHLCSGIITLALGGITLFLSVYSKWFERSTNGNYFVFITAQISVAFTIIWFLTYLLKNCWDRITK